LPSFPTGYPPCFIQVLNLIPGSQYLNKLESKIKGQLSKHAITKNLTQHIPQYNANDSNNSNFVISFLQFQRSLEDAGNALSRDEASFLFQFWDTCAGQQDPCGSVPVDLAINDLLHSIKGYPGEGNPFKSGVEPQAKTSGNKSNGPSQPGGIFGGGAYEADAASNRGNAVILPSTAVPPASSQKPYSNQSSQPGGIFGTYEPPPSTRGGGNGNKSNQSSVEGGIFAPAENETRQHRPNKQNSNTSSIPGGIFG